MKQVTDDFFGIGYDGGHLKAHRDDCLALEDVDAECSTFPKHQARYFVRTSSFPWDIAFTVSITNRQSTWLMGFWVVFPTYVVFNALTSS